MACNKGNIPNDGLNKRQRKRLQQLVSEGWDEDIALAKLLIYNFNIEEAKKYKDIDNFCHKYAAFGHCNNTSLNHFSHTYNIEEMCKEDKGIILNLKAKYLLEYLINNIGWDPVPRLYWLYADLMGNNKIFKNKQIAIKYYESSLSTEQDYQVIQKYDKFLNQNNIICTIDCT